MKVENIRTFLHLETFSVRASGLLVFADSVSFGAAVMPFHFYLSPIELGKKLFTTKLCMISNVVTMASTPRASLDWARDYNNDVKHRPRRPDVFTRRPRRPFSARCMISWTASHVPNIPPPYSSTSRKR
jgi:hypothetical protein